MINSVILFLEYAAEKYPDKHAVEDSNMIYTFKGLQEKAYLWADGISSVVSKRNVPVVVYMPKTADAVAAIMAVLYCGDFYVPIDIKTPIERLKKIFSGLNPAVVMTTQGLAEKCCMACIDKEKILCVDEIKNRKVAKPIGYQSVLAIDPACIIYTSGSTGEPKGVVMPHRRILEEMEWAQAEFAFSSEERRGNVVPFQYVPHMYDIFLCIYVGYTLIIIPEELHSFPKSMAEYFIEKKITSMICVSSVLCMIADAVSLSSLSRMSFTHIAFVGEPMPVRQLNLWREGLPQTKLVQIYGSTETVFSTQYEVERVLEPGEQLPIGCSCLHTEVILVNEDGREITEPGMVGELYVRGHLALGYWNAPDETRKAFVQNPLHNLYPERVYRTGDFAMLNEKGELLFCGRKDSQIKHMGHRVEIGDIEAAAMNVPDLRRCCVIYDSDKKQLVMFYEAGQEISVKQIRSVMGEQLPSQMIPHVYLHYTNFPKNQNGKIDRRILQEEYEKSKVERKN